MLKLKSLIKEGFAWERKADGSLPTLKDAIAVHEANEAKKDINEYGATPSKENWKGWFVLNANLRGDTTYWKKGELVKAYKSADSDHVYVVTGDANYDASDEWAQSDFKRIAVPLNKETHKKSYNYVIKLEKSHQLKPWEIMTPRWQDNDRDGKWYEKGDDVKEIAEGHNDHGILDLVSMAEDKLQRLRSNMATNSVLQREEKMGYLRAFDELLDILSDIGVSAEME